MSEYGKDLDHEDELAAIIRGMGGTLERLAVIRSERPDGASVRSLSVAITEFETASMWAEKAYGQISDKILRQQDADDD